MEKNPGALKAALAAPVLKDGEATLRKSGLRIEYKLRAFVGKSWPKSNTIFAILHIHIFEFFFSSSTFQKFAIVKRMAQRFFSMSDSVGEGQLRRKIQKLIEAHPRGGRQSVRA